MLSIWLAIKIRVNYIKDENYLNVTYPPKFYGYCRMALVAKDVASNYWFIYFDITVEPWAQTACIKCTGSEVSQCQQWDQHYILNRKTGKWLPVLTVNSLASIKFIGMFVFFVLVCVVLPVSLRLTLTQ